MLYSYLFVSVEKIIIFNCNVVITIWFRRQYGTTTCGINVHHHFKGKKFTASKHSYEMAEKQQVPYNYLGISDFGNSFR